MMKSCYVTSIFSPQNQERLHLWMVQNKNNNLLILHNKIHTKKHKTILNSKIKPALQNTPVCSAEFSVLSHF